MIVVIIAGGSGTRLWPISTPQYPKHLLRVNGDSNSLLQNTFERAKRLTSADKVYVVSEAGHIHHVKDQLNELSDENFIVEPARRGTASCIIAALVHIASRHKSDEPISFLAADHYIRDIAGFAQSFKLAGSASEKYKRVVLVGVEPDYPATGFGYIQKGELLDESSFVYNVHSFREKPDYETAQNYVKSGSYLWNCGYFVGSVDTFKKTMEAYSPELLASYKKLDAASKSDYEGTYLGFENISIDYALIEKVKDLLVIQATFDWMDLGSFADLHKAVGHDVHGNHIQGENIETEEVEGSFIQNYDDKPVAVIGLDNVVIVNSPDGILIARKDMSQKVGEVSKRFKK